jgi:hypothetical protein
VISISKAAKPIRDSKAWARKRHRGARRSISSGDSSTESSSENIATSEGLSIEGTGASTNRKRRKKHSKSSLTEEFKKAKPPTFDGEVKGEEAEVWLLGLKKYF